METAEQNGIINILKPPNMTSFDVVAYLRRLLGIRKIGHAGTLDPGAAGVLTVCLGRATRAIEFLMEKRKLYRAELTLGISTDTQDGSGEVISVKRARLNEAEICRAIESFKGPQLQTPPMYSSVRVKGVRLYELARKGVTIDREQRSIVIYYINTLKIGKAFVDCAGESMECFKVLFDVECSKGTYIRTLCSDIGDRLGCGGHMSFLLRLRAGSFDICDAFTIEEIAEKHRQGVLADSIMGVDRAFGDLKRLEPGDLDLKRFLNGISIPAGKACAKGERVRIYDRSGKFTAIAEVTSENGVKKLKAKKQF